MLRHSCRGLDKCYASAWGRGIRYYVFTTDFLSRLQIAVLEEFLFVLLALVFCNFACKALFCAHVPSNA